MRKLMVLALVAGAGFCVLPVYADQPAGQTESYSTPGMSAREIRREARRTSRARIRPRRISSVCRTIRSVNFLIKADTSTHIPGGDSRRGSYSVIGSGSNCSPCSGRCNIYYSDGTSAGSVGYYGQWSRSHGGNGCARYYGGAGGAPSHSASSIISNARRKSGGNFLYLQGNSRTKLCYKWTASLRRVGGT